MNEAERRAEAQRLSRYLIGKSASDALTNRYLAATATAVEIGSDLKVARFLAQHPSMLGFVDAGLVLLDPTSMLRWKLNVMSAILEANPEHADAFLPIGRRWSNAPLVGMAVVRAAVRGVIGFVLVAAIR